MENLNGVFAFMLLCGLGGLAGFTGIVFLVARWNGRFHWRSRATAFLAYALACGGLAIAALSGPVHLRAQADENWDWLLIAGLVGWLLCFFVRERPRV